MKFEEKERHPWCCNLSRGDRPCRWVFPQSGGDSFLCCTWKEGHPATLRHETVYNEDEMGFSADQSKWVYRPDLTIWEMQRYSQ